MADTKPSDPVPTGPTQPVNHTPANPAPSVAPGQPKPKLEIGKLCNHPCCPDGTFSAGTGKILAIDKDTVTVEVCFPNGTCQNKNFKDSDLTNAN